MEEPSTPAEPVVQADGSQEPSQSNTAPVAADQTPSQEQPNPEPQAQSEEEEPAQAPAQDDDLADWAGKQGIDLSNPSPEDVRNIAKRLRDTQKAYTSSQQALKAAQEFSKETQSSFNDNLDEIDDPLERQIAYLTVNQRNTESALAAERFFSSHPEYVDVRQEMAKIVADDIARYGSHMNDYWQDNLEKLGEMARGVHAESTKHEAYEQGRQEERASVARQQAMATPKAHATNPSSGPAKITSVAQIRSMTPEERKSRQEEIFAYFANQ